MYTQIGILMMILYFIADFLPKNTNIFYRKILLFLLIFLFWWVGGLAYKLGLDNYHYEFFYYIQNSDNYRYFELGYKLINRIFFKLGLDFYIFKGILYFLLVILTYKGIKKFFQRKKDIMLVFLLLFSYGLFYYDYISFIRQAIAISIFIYSLQFIYAKKKTIFFMLIGVACLFHRTAIVLYFLYFMFNNKNIAKIIYKKENIILIVVFLSKIILIKYELYDFLLFFISKVFVFIPRIEYYLVFNYNELINIYDILALVIVLTNKLLKIRYFKKESELMKYFLIVYCFYTIFNNFSFMVRFKLYIDIFLITSIVILINKYTLINRYTKIFKYIFIILFFMRFNILTQNNFFYTSIFPYQNYTYKLFKNIKFENTQQFLHINERNLKKIEDLI